MEAQPTGRKGNEKEDDIFRPLLERAVWPRTGAGDERKWLQIVRRWAAERDDCLWLDRVETSRSCRVAGVVTRLRIDPGAGVVEVAISDGKASLGAQWSIRQPVAQLRASPGEGLILEGIARIGPGGELLMIEPAFEIVPGPPQP